MRIYRTDHTTNDGHQGYEFHANLADAKKEKGKLRKLGYDPDDLEYAINTFTIERIDITASKRGILNALNRFASHPDNG